MGIIAVFILIVLVTVLSVYSAFGTYRNTQDIKALASVTKMIGINTEHIYKIFEILKERRYEYKKGFNDAMQGKQESMYEGIDGKWHKKDW